MADNFDPNQIIIKRSLKLIKKHPAIIRIEKDFPMLSPNKLIEFARKEENREDGHHIYSHIIGMLDRAFLINKNRGLHDSDLIETVIIIIYHDIAKILEPLICNDPLLKQIFKLELGHSHSIRRLFFYIDEPEIAHSLRHNSTDFILDITNQRVTIPQLVLNLLDKTDRSGTKIRVWEKYADIKSKIGHLKGYDDFAERLACKYLDRVDNENVSLYDYEFITRNKIPYASVIFIQRFDGKYCAPIGKYRDTSSNLKIAEVISKNGYKTTILHEGKFRKHLHNQRTTILGCDAESIDQLLPVYCTKKDLIIVEGSTKRLSKIQNIKDPNTPLVLLLRTLATGTLGNRIKLATKADEIWVMTDNMLKTVKDELNTYQSSHPKQPIPSVKILQSGYDKRLFNISNETRIRGKITYVGAITNLKGVDILIEAFKEIRKTFPIATLHLIGNPEIYGSINDFDIRKIRNIPGIIYHGILPSKKIAEHLKTAHVSVLLTQIYETFGKSAMQARVCGTPIIVSNKGALPWHARTKKDGIVVNNVNKKSVIKALSKFLNHDPMTVPPELGKYHTWEITALDFITNYNLLSRKTFQSNYKKLR